jgi:KipI family sensor histidine kinase inhibitor
MRRVGDHSALLEFADNAAVQGAARVARERFGDQLVEVVPGHETLLVVWRPGSVVHDISELALERASSEISDDDAPRSAAITIPVRYDGADLDSVAATLGLSREAVVKTHVATDYTVAFVGFSPGFPYLVAPEVVPLLEMPRLATPRTEVPVGSVAVAAGYCGIYPRASPGGWNLLGRTEVVLFDPGLERPALLSSVEVISPGPLTTIQDLGRPGWAHVGVPRSGAADRPALVLANRLVGNADGAAALESTLTGPRLRFAADAVIALSGAVVDASLGERPVPMNAAVRVAGGETLKLGTARTGLRTYIAFTGGIDAPLTLGSAATDTLTGLGPEPLRRGDVLVCGAGRASGAPAPTYAPPPKPALRIIFGPREDWFTATAGERIVSEAFTVSPASNRVGVRLDGPPLERARVDELPSEGMVPGAIQVPPSGQPILLLADHPTTGGYPVIAVVIEEDLHLAAQLRPGQELRFTAIS